MKDEEKNLEKKETLSLVVERSVSHLWESILESQHKFLYRRIPEMTVATDWLSILARYFKQFQKKEISYKTKVLIEEVNLDEILERMVVGGMWVISKKLWMVALKLWAALKNVLTNKRDKESLNESTYT